LGRPGGGRVTAPQPAFILHHYDWSESSVIVDLFTRAQGRVVVVARGAKKPTSNFRAVLLPFAPLHVHLGRAAAEDEAPDILPLRSADWAGGQPLLQPAALLSGFYLNELLLKLLARQDPHAVLFDAYADTLAALAADADDNAALRAFELALLRELGWLPDLATATLTAQPVQPDARYALQPEAGITPHAQGPHGRDWVALEAALRHGSTAALRAACAPVAAALRGPLRSMLDYHLGTTKLRTRQVWQGVQRLAKSA
jgi:DNA repair protein RecO (recombination protein O)